MTASVELGEAGGLPHRTGDGRRPPTRARAETPERYRSAVARRPDETG